MDRDQMQTWLADYQAYPANAESADRALRMILRAKQSLHELAPNGMFDTEPVQYIAVLEAVADD